MNGNTSVDMYDPNLADASDRRSTETVQIKAVRCSQGTCLDNWGCKEGHRCCLCGVCKDRSPNGNPYAMGATGCVECKESNKAVVWIIAILFITLALLSRSLSTVDQVRWDRDSRHVVLEACRGHCTMCESVCPEVHH